MSIHPANNNIRKKKTNQKTVESKSNLTAPLLSDTFSMNVNGKVIITK